MTRAERVGWGNVALFAVIVCCLAVSAVAFFEVFNGEPPGTGAP